MIVPNGLHVMHTPDPDFPERRRYVDTITSSWVSQSPDAYVEVFEDPDRRGVLWNYQRALTAAIEQGGDSDWVIVCQDDIHLLEGWETELKNALRFAPAPFVSLCHFNTVGKNLVRKGIPYGLGVHTIWGQMVAYHRSIQEAYLEFVNDVIEMDFDGYRKWDDGLAASFNLLNGTLSCMTARAVVQHADERSVLGHNLGHWRHAHSTIEDTGPWWGLKPRSAAVGSVKPVHTELARQIKKFRSER